MSNGTYQYEQLYHFDNPDYSSLDVSLEYSDYKSWDEDYVDVLVRNRYNGVLEYRKLYIYLPEDEDLRE